MKKVFFAVILGFVANICYAGDIYISSNVATTNTRGVLCPTGQGAMLHSVCVVDAVASSTAAVYSSSFTTSNTITGTIDTSETGSSCYVFDVSAPNGLYSDHFGTASVTVLYQCYSRN